MNPEQRGGSAGRATTIALNYVLVLGISAILVSGLIIAGGTFVEDQRENVVRGELNVIGTHISGNLEQVDRYVSAGEGDTVAHVNQSFQRQVTGENYEINFVGNDGGPLPPQLVLSTPTTDVTVRVNASVRADVEDSRARGGVVSVFYEDGALVIGND